MFGSLFNVPLIVCGSSVFVLLFSTKLVFRF